MWHRKTDSPWLRLVYLARTGLADVREAAAPFGFSARVVAYAFVRGPSFSDLAAVYGGRALAVAWLLAFASVVLGYESIVDFLIEGLAAS